VRHHVAPIPCRPWTLNGLSERLVVSHYENNYGTAVRSLNTIRAELDDLDLATAPGHRLRSLKREELTAMGSVVLHETYFGNLGGDGKITTPMTAAIEEQFGTVDAWRREFIASAQAMAGGSGWALLGFSRRDHRLYNQVASDHAQAIVDALPILALDMYEHAYHIDFGANATAYIDAFMRNIDWATVGERMTAASGNSASGRGDAPHDPLPSISIEELAAEIVKNERIEGVQLLDARPKHYFSRNTDMMQGAIWRDPNRVDEWSKEFSVDAPVFVYCAYGFHVGCEVTAALRERGFDAKYVRGGLSAWYAAGGERALKAPEQKAINT
jgi:Fe-Mn family superoxide dismutase